MDSKQGGHLTCRPDHGVYIGRRPDTHYAPSRLGQHQIGAFDVVDKADRVLGPRDSRGTALVTGMCRLF
jgi:hypothetical protein